MSHRNHCPTQGRPHQSRTTDFDRLLRLGVSLPEPDSLSQDALREKLWEVIGALAELRVFLHNTDHLSDRELYTHLWEHGLRQEIVDAPPDPQLQTHLDLLGGCTEEDLQTYLRYYADEQYRRMWSEDFPEDNLPEHEDPPFDRDSQLPRE